jgi:hypothetical protein
MSDYLDPLSPLAGRAAGGFITGSEIVVDGGYHAMTI